MSDDESETVFLDAPEKFCRAPLPSVGLNDVDLQSETQVAQLRQLAWHGQRIPGNLPNHCVTRAAVTWLNVLLGPNGRSVASRLATNDERFYDIDRGRPKPRSQWSDLGDPKPWRCLFCHLHDSLDRKCRLTPIELEILLLLFHWSSDGPAFATWVHVRPDVLPAVEQFLRQRYCWPLLTAMERARGRKNEPPRLITSRQMPEPDHARHETRFDQRRYRAGGVRYPFYRLWGLVLVGYLAAFAIDPLQHLIWFGPWFASVVISLAACFGTWWLARVDVHTQHAGDIADREVDRRTWGLTWRLWGIGFVLSLVFNGVMFCPWFQYVPDAWYLITPRAQFEDGSVGSRGDTFVRQHPLQPLNGKTDGSPKHSSLAFWKPFVQWMVAGVTLGSLATLLGITVQWMWEDKSAIEPI